MPPSQPSAAKVADQPETITYQTTELADLRAIYLPLCSPDAAGLKSAITPFLSGDIKIDKYRYVTKPVSTEDLRENLRNVHFRIAGQDRVFAFTDRSPDVEARVEIGQLWHRLTMTYRSAGLEVEALNFVPVSGETVELMKIAFRNISGATVRIYPVASVPLFGRALANKHDHEQVTSLLNRITQKEEGVLLSPVMAFNEEGHQPVEQVYFVYGADGENRLPEGSYPTAEIFYGESGNRENPRAVLDNQVPVLHPAGALDGKEAVGALRFAECQIAPGASASCVVVTGTARDEAAAAAVFEKFRAVRAVDEALAANGKYWNAKSAAITVNSADAQFGRWLRWVTLQPVLRRIYGCSFLPDHDYGKGGKGWRDLWQDLLSLILIEPQNVRETLLNNLEGVRIDGSNATIIGTGKGEFIADRNAITRVWMDHGAWPLLTVMLYVHQTGDTKILFEKSGYFRDPQLSRSLKKDETWTPAKGNRLKTKTGRVYEGTVLEHLLLQNLVQFFNVGEHNVIRLESADWNDGLDMAFDRGESVAFSSFYAGNLLALADLLEDLKKEEGLKSVEVLSEMAFLLDTLKKTPCDYKSAAAKHKLLFDKYCPSVQPAISGKKVKVKTDDLVKDLRRKGQWLFGHIRRQERVSVKQDGKTFRWFNGYYDNAGKRVEGGANGHPRMTLTGQVFALMSRMARPEDVDDVIAAADALLKDPKMGGYRLNTDFGVDHYLDLGRAFGFAFGTKENGAFFSHMSVMYAYALYVNGRTREGFAVMDGLYRMSCDVGRSRIYPGVPEYFDSNGRGMYHYLTGSASWYVLTVLTQMFGVRGHYGDLVLDPQLTAEQFSADGKATAGFSFAGKSLRVEYLNPARKDTGTTKIRAVSAQGRPLAFELLERGAVISRKEIAKLDNGSVITVELQ